VLRLCFFIEALFLRLVVRHPLFFLTLLFFQAHSPKSNHHVMLKILPALTIRLSKSINLENSLKFSMVQKKQYVIEALARNLIGTFACVSRRVHLIVLSFFFLMEI
jgi:hypothetical protein